MDHFEALLGALPKRFVLPAVVLEHPHDLRHRRATLWHHSGMPARELAHRGGRARASLPHDVYTHTKPLGEVPDERLEKLPVSSRAPGLTRDPVA